MGCPGHFGRRDVSGGVMYIRASCIRKSKVGTNIWGNGDEALRWKRTLEKEVSVDTLS